MQDIQRIRYLAANYPNLQGLRVVPLGLLLFLVVVWANSLHGPARLNIALPVLFSLCAVALSLWINRFYALHYGRVRATRQRRAAELILNIAGGVVGIAAFIGDVTLKLPFSLVGFLFAGAFVFEFLRSFRPFTSLYLTIQTAVCSLLVLLVNLLPLLGLPGWWGAIGMRSHFLAVLTVVGALFVVFGLSGHLYLLRQFRSAGK